jgi:hypothetical protein
VKINSPGFTETAVRELAKSLSGISEIRRSARHIGRNLDFVIKNDNNRYQFRRHKIGKKC